MRSGKTAVFTMSDLLVLDRQHALSAKHHGVRQAGRPAQHKVRVEVGRFVRGKHQPRDMQTSSLVNSARE